MSKTSEATVFPLQCATLDPLCYAPAKLMIVDILNMKPLLGSRSLFMYKTHPINYVDVFGFVTSLKRKEDSLMCDIDDGTGKIRCFCQLKGPREFMPPERAAVSALSGPLQDRLLAGKIHSTISLGDFLNIRGQLKLSLRDNVVYVTTCKWNVLDGPESDDLWLEKLTEQINLYDQVYDKPFQMDENLRKSSKSFVTKQVRETLLRILKPVLNQFITDPTNMFEFYGYELLEMEEIKKCFASCFSGTRIAASVDYLSENEKKCISLTVVANLLHSYVVEGELIKKSSLKHESVTNFNQLDARYFVTVQCHKVIDAVKKIFQDLSSKQRSVGSSSILRHFDVSDFNFIRFSKHGDAIINTVLHLIKDNFNHGQSVS